MNYTVLVLDAILVLNDVKTFQRSSCLHYQTLLNIFTKKLHFYLQLFEQFFKISFSFNTAITLTETIPLNQNIHHPSIYFRYIFRLFVRWLRYELDNIWTEILARKLKNQGHSIKTVFNAFYLPVNTGNMNSSSFIVRVILH